MSEYSHVGMHAGRYLHFHSVFSLCVDTQNLKVHKQKPLSRRPFTVSPSL